MAKLVQLKDKNNEDCFPKLDTNIITGYISRHYVSMPTAWQSNDLGTIQQQNKIGNRLSISNGNIIIGDNISFVKVSGYVEAINTSAVGGDKVFNIRRNGGSQAGQYMNGADLGWRPMSLPPILIAVAKGDAIDLGIVSGCTGSMEVLECKITVEAVY